MTFWTLLLFFLPLTAYGDRTKASISDLLQEIRNPIFGSNERSQALSLSTRILKMKLSEELHVPVAELSSALISNPTKSTLLLEDEWSDLQTEYYTTLHLEAYHRRWLGLQRLVKFSDYGKSIHRTIMAQWTEFSPREEGRFYVRWNNAKVKTGNRQRSHKLPHFLMSDSVDDLVTIESFVPYEELEKNTSAFEKGTSGLSKVQKQELSERIELNRRIAIRAVGNTAKTVASLYLLTGVLSKEETENKLKAHLNDACRGCTATEKRDFLISAMRYVELMSSSVRSKTIPEIVRNFCSSLKRNHYYWNVDRIKPMPLEILVDQRKLVNYYVSYKLAKKNQEALGKTILSQDHGALFLTKAMNVIDKSGFAVATRLQCTPESSSVDQTLVRTAIEEAVSHVRTYAKTVSSKVNDQKLNIKLTTSRLEYFIQTNQAAVAEAMASFPQGIGYVLKSLAEVDQDTRRRKKWDTIVVWGSAISGIGITLTGFLAPEGIATLLSAVTLLKNINSGSYYLVRSRQEGRFFREMQEARAGAAGLSATNMRMHYNDFKALQVSYISDFMSTSSSFRKISKLAIQKMNGDLVKAKSLLKRVFDAAKASAKDTTEDQLKSNLIDMALEMNF